MGRLLNYLFEVTDRFGMETRTELILLQRTMVVVEGVARSLNPHINIWNVSKPIVEEYIRKNIGPRAAARDLLRTARVLSRFGPRLPELAEAALVRTSVPVEIRPWRAVWSTAGFAGLGALLFGLGLWVGVIL